MSPTLRLAGIAALLFALVACGSGFDRSSAIESFRVANEEATEDQASCVVDALVDTYGLDQLENELAHAKASRSALPEKVAPELVVALT